MRVESNQVSQSGNFSFWKHIWEGQKLLSITMTKNLRRNIKEIEKEEKYYLIIIRTKDDNMMMIHNQGNIIVLLLVKF